MPDLQKTIRMIHIKASEEGPQKRRDGSEVVSPLNRRFGRFGSEVLDPFQGLVSGLPRYCQARFPPAVQHPGRCP